MNDHVEARLAELEAEVRALRDQVAAENPPTTTPVSRRRLLGMAGAATAGAIGSAVLTASPAGAVDVPVVIDNTSQTGTGTTTLTSSTTNDAFRIVNSGGGIAMQAQAAGGRALNALGSGVTDAVVKAEHSGNGWGVYGVSASSTGVRGDSTTGDGVVGLTQSASSVVAAAPVSNSGAHLRLPPATGFAAGPPANGLHSVGQFWLDANGVLFQCVEVGSPGTWMRQAPLVTLASPVRVYDSRSGQPNQSPNTQGSLAFTSAPPSSAFRDVACNKNASSGTTVVPAGARTLLMNLAIVSISGVGALNAYATGTTQPATANINWSAGGQVLSNAVTSACSTTQHVDFAIVASSGAATHFIVDVIGYYL